MNDYPFLPYKPVFIDNLPSSPNLATNVIVSGHIWQYPAVVTGIHDGDTFYANVALSPTITLHETPVRFEGWNADELGTPSGEIAKEVLIELLPVGTKVMIHQRTNEKYRRVFGKVYKLDGTDVVSETERRTKRCSSQSPSALTPQATLPLCAK